MTIRVELLEELKQLWHAVEVLECFGTRDLRRMEDLEQELGVDRYVHHPNTGEVKWFGNSVECPLCYSIMWYNQVDGVHVWDCEDCPGKLLEYHTDEDLRRLIK